MSPGATGSVVNQLRREILDGRFQPGDRLDEVSLGDRFNVSRNTLREAFRVLSNDNLTEHRPHRGVFVRRLSVKEARNIYRARRIIECGALREAGARRVEYAQLEGEDLELAEGLWAQRLRRMHEVIQEGLDAAARGDWQAVGNHNNDFHLALTALADNHVLNRGLRRTLTELRLLFVVVAPAREVHEPYLAQNERIAALVEAGDLTSAIVAVEDYLIRAEQHLVGAYAAQSDQAPLR